MTPSSRATKVVAAIVFTVIAVPILYALSVGPAQHVIGDSEAWNVIYGPLDAAAAACRPLDVFLQWYYELWR